MNIVLLGPPGAGKGTQARLLQERHHLELISTGNMLREERHKETPLGKHIKEFMDKGLFSSDDLVLELFENRFLQVRNQGTILDGVPRTLYQAEKIDRFLEQIGDKLHVVIQLVVNDEELIHRLATRTVCKGCGVPYTGDYPPEVKGVCDKCSGDLIRRQDDDPAIVKVRLEVHNEQTKPLADYYAQTGRLKNVDGMRSVEEVEARIEEILTQCSSGSA